MNYSVLVPSFPDVASLFAYVVDNPYLFISSSTVMTTGLLVAAMTLGLVASASRFVPVVGTGILSRLARALRWCAPKLALMLAYFGIGSFVLATEILLRFHRYIPLETEIQFRSGLGHLVVAVVGIVALSPFLREVRPREWIVANFWALGYWAVHVLLLTPPWFAFQGQLDLVLGVAKAWLGIGFAVTLYLHRRSFGAV